MARLPRSLFDIRGCHATELRQAWRRLGGYPRADYASKHLCASFASPSGNGLKAWFYVPPDANLHAGSFRAVEKYMLELTRIQIDQACKDVGRLCFVSDDPEAYYNPNRCELAPLPEPEKPKLAVVANVNLSGGSASRAS